MKHVLDSMKSSVQTWSVSGKFSIATQRLLLSILFLGGAALIPLQANAVPGVSGNSTTANQVVNNAAAWTTLRSVTVSNPGRTFRQCVATGSSDGLNHGVIGTHQYRFTLSVDNLNPPVDTGPERTLEFQNQNGGFLPEIGSFGQGDNSIKEITSTGGVFSIGPIGPGRHNIRWQARKIGRAANLTVADSSLTVVCADQQFVLIPEPNEIPLNRIQKSP